MTISEDATSAVSPAILTTGDPLAVTNASAPMLASVGQIYPFASGSTESKHEASDAQSSVSSKRGMFSYSHPSPEFTELNFCSASEW